VGLWPFNIIQAEEADLSSRNLYSRIKCDYGEWRTIEDFPDYEVSDSGFVRHMNRRYRVLLGGVTAKGYLTVVLMRDYAPHTKTVHSLSSRGVPT
jgi:hypothetical protein